MSRQRFGRAASESLGNKLLAQPVAVSIGGIEKGHPQIERFVHEGDRFAFSEVSPPPGGYCPKPKPDFADPEISVFIGRKLHNEIITAEDTEVTEKNCLNSVVPFAFSAVKFRRDHRSSTATFDCWPWLDRESRFKRADSGPCRRNSAPKCFRAGSVRVLERRAKFARRAFVVRSGNDSRSLGRAKFHQRRLFHADSDSARAGVDWENHQTCKWTDLELQRTGRQSSAYDRIAGAARPRDCAEYSGTRDQPIDRRSRHGLE